MEKAIDVDVVTSAELIADSSQVCIRGITEKLLNFLCITRLTTTDIKTQLFLGKACQRVLEGEYEKILLNLNIKRRELSSA